MRKLIVLLSFALFLGGCDNPVTDIINNDQDSDSHVESTDGKSAKQDYDDYFLESGFKYYYASLNDAQKVWYEDMEHILGSMTATGALSSVGVEAGLTEKDLEHVFTCVCMDHPELFFVDGLSYVTHLSGESVVGYDFSGTYGMDVAEAKKRKNEIEAAAKEIIDGYDGEANDYDKIKYVYETLIWQTDYDLNAPDNQTIYSSLVGKRSVCQGYSKAMQYLLLHMGIDCSLVQGVALGQPHGWNLVRADGDFYYVDVTWGDVSYHEDYNDNDGAPDIMYEYLMVTTDEIMREHIIDQIAPLPICTARDDNYFIHEGAYFTNVDERGLRELFEQATSENNYQVSLKCATPGCYSEIMSLLLDKNKIFDYYSAGGNRVSYYENENMLCMTFWVTN